MTETLSAIIDLSLRIAVERNPQMSSSRNTITTYLVLFQSDINRGYMCNYDDIKGELEGLGKKVVEFRTDTWFFDCHLSASEINKHLRHNLSGAESLIVAAIGSDAASFGILPEKLAAVVHHSTGG
jgi:hypothetical protein